MQQQQQKSYLKPVFEYSGGGHTINLKASSGIHGGGMDLTNPMSELSYSYSEMVNDYDGGSGYGTNKFRSSGAPPAGSYLKNSQPTHATYGSGGTFAKDNNTIEEDTEEN